jgi:hypothetical protein
VMVLPSSGIGAGTSRDGGAKAGAKAGTKAGAKAQATPRSTTKEPRDPGPPPVAPVPIVTAEDLARDAPGEAARFTDAVFKGKIAGSVDECLRNFVINANSLAQNK